MLSNRKQKKVREVQERVVLILQIMFVLILVVVHENNCYRFHSHVFCIHVVCVQKHHVVSTMPIDDFVRSQMAFID